MAAQTTQDFWGQFEVAEYDTPQYDWGQYEEVPQNKHALEASLKELPQDDPYVQTQKQQTDLLANMLFTQAEINAMEQQGKMGWVEYRSRGFIGWSDITPVLGTVKQVYQSGKALNIAKKLENGEDISDADKAYMKDYLRNYVECQKRGLSWSAKGASMFVQAPSFMIEFALSGGLGEVAAKGVAAASAKGASKLAVKGATKAAARIAGQQAVLVPMYATANYNERKIADGLNVTDKGDMIFNSAQAESNNKVNALKGLGTGEIQILSEMSGGVIGKMASGIAGAIGKGLGKVATTNTARGISATSAKIYNSLPKDVRVKLEAALRVADNLRKGATKAGQKAKEAGGLVGFHGVAEEMGEERAEDILMTAFDLDSKEGYSADQWMSAIFPEPQELLLEAGIFSIVGASSLATQTVFNDLTSKGYSEKEANTITQNLSEIEKENMANEILGEVNINEDIKEQDVIKEQYKIENNMIQAGISMNVNAQGEEINPTDGQEETSKPKNLTDYKQEISAQKFENHNLPYVHRGSYKGRAWSRVLQGSIDNEIVYAERDFNSLISELYKNPNVVNDSEQMTKLEEKLDKITNRLPEEPELLEPFYEKFYNAVNSASEYSKLKESRSKKVAAAELYEIAYHGTPHKFDKFSLENIGTGEGAQAHGWGLYFAGDKNVSEEYRRKLSGNKVFYNGEELAQSYFYTHQWVQGKDVEENKRLSNLRSVIDDIGEIQANKKISLEEARQEFIKEYQSKKKLLAYQKKYLEIAKDIDTSKIDIQKGQLFEVDIPENDVLLDEDKKINEQPEKVIEALKELCRNEGFNYMKLVSGFGKQLKPQTGKQIYSNLRNYIQFNNPEISDKESAKQASLLLNEYGIKGITYDGKQDGRCYVIFDDKAIDVKNTFYDISEEAPKKQPKTEQTPITQEAETVEDELEVPETVADKIIRGESRFGKLYTEWVDRYTPIENLVKKAEQKLEQKGGEKLDTSSNPYFQARMYAGLVESIKEQVNDKTFVKENGKIKITGEGFLPIINDYVEQIKDVEPNYDNAIEDLSDYLIANRYLLDLKDRDGYEATEEQKLKAVSDMTKLNLKYGDKIEDVSKIADRIYAFNQRILHNLVDSGNMSQETYDKIIEQNPHHISYKRVMDDNGIGQDFFAKPKFTDAKSPIKKIRGSERDIQNIFVSTLEDVSRILDTAERNKVARSVANLKDILPEYIQDKKPAMEKRTAKVKVTYDAKMRSQLEEAIKYFGRTFKNVKSIKTPTGYALGSYSEEEKEVRKKLGSQDRTLAHEVGHMLDFALDVENQIKNDSKIMQEIKTLAEDRFKSTVTLQDGEYITEEGENTEKYKKYVRSNKEAIANAFDLYFTSRDYVKRVAPETAKFIDNLFKGEYAFLNEIRPSSETATEEIEQDVWTPSRNKPYGNVIQYFENGKPKFVEVTKPVMDAVEGMNSQEIDFVNKFLTGSATMLRTGATITPEFAIRNFIRDQESATIYIKNYNPFIDGVRGLMNVLGKKVTGKNETYDEWVKAGGAFGSYMELNEKSVNKALKEFVGEGSRMRSIFSYANPLKLAEDFSSIFEQATRLGMYTRSKMNGADAMEAALEAREGTLDFGRSGSLGRKYNRILPFFNAGIQGVDKMVRTFRDHPYLSSVKAIGTMTIPQLALTGYYLYFAPDDDREEYLNIPQFQKDFFFCFKLGQNWVRIPKDFTLGYVFGSVPERFLTWAYQNKKPEGKDLAEMALTLFGSVSPVNNPTDALPPIFRTAIEDIANYSFFRNQHIYPEYLNELEPSLRANKFNSETSIWLGEKLNMSPAKIDHTINSLLGTSGRYLTDAGDLMINSVREFNGEETNEKVKTLADAPFLRGFVLRDPVGYQAVSTNEFFENYKKVSQAHMSYNKYKKSGDREKANEYKEKHNSELRAYSRMNNTRAQISDLGKQMDKIYSDKNLTNKEKQERLQPLAKRISDIAFETNVWYGEFTKE